MAEYIEREAAKKALGDAHFKNYGDAIMVIMDIPAADVKPVVRCKDCRYSRKPDRYDWNENKACEGVLVCCVGFDHVYPSSDDWMIFVDENWFCADGKKREES